MAWESRTDLRGIRNSPFVHPTDRFAESVISSPSNFFNLDLFNNSNSKTFPIPRRGWSWKLKPLEGFRFPRKGLPRQPFLDYPCHHFRNQKTDSWKRQVFQTHTSLELDSPLSLATKGRGLAERAGAARQSALCLSITASNKLVRGRSDAIDRFALPRDERGQLVCYFQSGIIRYLFR